MNIAVRRLTLLVSNLILIFGLAACNLASAVKIACHSSQVANVTLTVWRINRARYLYLYN